MGPILRLFSHVKKAQINSADVLADALEKAYKKLKEQIKGHSDLDADIQVRKQDRVVERTFLSYFIFTSDRESPIT